MHVVRKNGNVCTLFHSSVFVGDAASSSDNSTFIRFSMLYLISWFLVLALLAIWSAGLWLLHVMASWSITGASALMAQSQHLDAVSLPAWITLWVPTDWVLAVKAVAVAALPSFEAALSALPSPQVWLGPLAWTVWAIGCLILVVCGVLLHTLLAVTRRAAR